MALYKSIFEKFVEELTCQRCKNMLLEPVVLLCGDNICLACAEDMKSKEKESDIKGLYPCPVCLDGMKLRHDFDGYTYNRQLGKAALVTNVIKELISVWCSTARRLTSDRDSGVGNEDRRSEASFVTGHFLASMELPPNMAPGGALLHNLERYKSVFEKLVNVLLCPQCKNLFSDPVLMYHCGYSICSTCAADSVSKEGGIWCDCPVCGETDLERCSNTQLGKAALVVNVINKVMAWWYNTVRRVTSDRDSGVGSEEGRSKASFVTGVSWGSMDPPPNMAAGGALFYHFTVELYKWAFQELVNVLSCQRCNDVFRDPVIMDCGHSICSVCAVDRELEAEQELYECPLCGDEQIMYYSSNSELGEAALVVNEIKAVISGGSTARRVPSDPDSGVRRAGARSESSFVTAYYWASKGLPPNMAQGGALLYQFSFGLYKLALQEVGDVLTCQQCKKLFTNPVVMDCGHNLCLACAADTPSKHEGGRQCPVCGYKQTALYSNNHQLGKAALLANVTKEVISLVASNQDSGIGSEDARSKASFVSSHSQAGMDHPSNMLPDAAGIPDGLSNVKHNQILSWVSSADSTKPPNRASSKGFTNKRTSLSGSVGSPYSVASPGSISSPEHPPSMDPQGELETSSILDGDQGESEGQEEHLSTASNCTLTNRAHCFHLYPARPDQTKSSSLHALWELMMDSRIDGRFVEDVIVACRGVLNNSTSVQAPEHPDPTNTSVWDLK